MWLATRYLSGSTSNEVPYEVVYSITLALKDWLANEESAITTALLDEQNYHFSYADPSGLIKQVVPKFDLTLIHIALPKLYTHRPLYNVALYHELGHFIDSHYGIVKYSLLTHAIPHPSDSDEFKREVNHRKEFFADLFAASYTGLSLTKLLSNIANGHDANISHPSTTDRISNIDDLLQGKTNKMIEMFGEVLKARSLPELTIRYKAPDLNETFDNIRPYAIEGSSEMHGIIESGWEYLDNAIKLEALPWSDLGEEETDIIVNDLIEKSIRNGMIETRWRDGIT